MARNAAAYDEDFFAWTQEQARLLRSGELSELDIENIAEELESLGRSDKREIDNRLVVLLVHLLKWQVQVGFRSRSWSATVREQREQIQDLLSESPSLRSRVVSIRRGLYTRARQVAASETGLPETTPRRMPVHPRAGSVGGFPARRLRSYGGRCSPAGEIVKIS
jgi:hypothetical protein